MRICHDEWEEFEEGLREDVSLGLVDRDYPLRFHWHREPAPEDPVHAVILCVSYVRRDGGLTELMLYVGDEEDTEDGENEMLPAVRSFGDTLRRFAEELGLTLRPGRYLP
jgi:hypothetical protein